MESQLKTTKYFFILMICIAASFFIGAIRYAVMSISESTERLSKEKRACQTADIAFADAVKIKNSTFYKYQLFYVVSKTDYGMELKFAYNTQENIMVRCLDVEKVVQ